MPAKNTFSVTLDVVTLLEISLNSIYNADINAPVAQLDRVLDYESIGWGFKSLQACFF